MKHLAPAALLVLAACAPEPSVTAVEPAQQAGATAPPAPAAPVAAPAPTAPAEAATPALALDGEGLRLFDRATGSARPIAFGTTQQATLAALAFRGPPGSGTQSECGAGALDYAAWPDGLKLYFQRGKFVGWAADGRGKGALATAAGVGPGSSRSALTDAYAATFTKTTLGTEFAAGGIYGLLDGPGPAATISDLWAGASCNFR